jgi:hypothetical protein
MAPSTPGAWTASTRRRLGGTRPMSCWGSPLPSARRGSVRTGSHCWPARPPPAARRWRLRGLNLRGQCRNGRRGGGPWATPDGTGRRCPTTTSGHVVGRGGQAWGQGLGGPWGRTAWRRRGGAGRKLGPKQCSTAGRCGVTGMGQRLGRVTAHHRTRACPARPPPHQPWPTLPPWSGRPDQPAVHEFWSHSIDFHPSRSANPFCSRVQ